MTQIPLSIALCLVATGLYGCVVQPVNSAAPQPVYGGSDANPPADAVPYGMDGKLDAQQTTALLNLQFPQSYEAVKNRLSFPAYRDSTADYYQLSDGRWVKVLYNEQGGAIGFQFGDRE